MQRRKAQADICCRAPTGSARSTYLVAQHEDEIVQLLHNNMICTTGYRTSMVGHRRNR